MVEYRHTYYVHALKGDTRKLKVHYIIISSEPFVKLSFKAGD